MVFLKLKINDETDYTSYKLNSFEFTKEYNTNYYILIKDISPTQEKKNFTFTAGSKVDGILMLLSKDFNSKIKDNTKEDANFKDTDLLKFNGFIDNVEYVKKDTKPSYTIKICDAFAYSNSVYFSSVYPKPSQTFGSKNNQNTKKYISDVFSEEDYKNTINNKVNIEEDKKETDSFGDLASEAYVTENGDVKSYIKDSIRNSEYLVYEKLKDKENPENPTTIITKPYSEITEIKKPFKLVSRNSEDQVINFYDGVVRLNPTKYYSALNNDKTIINDSDKEASDALIKKNDNVKHYNNIMDPFKYIEEKSEVDNIMNGDYLNKCLEKENIKFKLSCEPTIKVIPGGPDLDKIKTLNEQKGGLQTKLKNDKKKLKQWENTGCGKCKHRNTCQQYQMARLGINDLYQNGTVYQLTKEGIEKRNEDKAEDQKYNTVGYIKSQFDVSSGSKGGEKLKCTMCRRDPETNNPIYTCSMKKIMGKNAGSNSYSKVNGYGERDIWECATQAKDCNVCEKYHDTGKFYNSNVQDGAIMVFKRVSERGTPKFLGFETKNHDNVTLLLDNNGNTIKNKKTGNPINDKENTGFTTYNMGTDSLVGGGYSKKTLGSTSWQDSNSSTNDKDIIKIYVSPLLLTMHFSVPNSIKLNKDIQKEQEDIKKIDTEIQNENSKQKEKTKVEVSFDPLFNIYPTFGIKFTKDKNKKVEGLSNYDLDKEFLLKKVSTRISNGDITTNMINKNGKLYSDKSTSVEVNLNVIPKISESAVEDSSGKIFPDWTLKKT